MRGLGDENDQDLLDQSMGGGGFEGGLNPYQGSANQGNQFGGQRNNSQTSQNNAQSNTQTGTAQQQTPHNTQKLIAPHGAHSTQGHYNWRGDMRNFEAQSGNRDQGYPVNPPSGYQNNYPVNPPSQNAIMRVQPPGQQTTAQSLLSSPYAVPVLIGAGILAFLLMGE